METTVAVIGGGSWATALVKLLSENEVVINWWLRSKTDLNHIINYGHNPRYLSGIHLNLKKIKPQQDLREAIEPADIVLLAVPSAFVKDVLDSLPDHALQGKIIVSAIKGMIRHENVLVTDYVNKRFGIAADDLLAIAGPCHAEEVALEKLSYLTICGANIAKAKAFANLISCRYLKATAIEDLAGAEYCAVMKNIIAIACGIAHGLNYGDNFQAVLVANAMQEIRRFLDAVAPIERDLNASAYLGDLLVTTYSQFSRNRTFGSMVGRGYSVKSAQFEMQMVAEGYYAVACIYPIMKKYQVKMPITQAVYNILYEKISPIVEFQILRDLLS
ncbi:NAD(P)H-dependent glycerol-3-phosphate dehydrogenase [Rhodoflexus caldus]|uniref:NAD(P)H-dependent glycerol-3-phosphate dehydrogenase n=1 Tax=Rhodoflexus caldus TaxID=2891236 RepID=UPI00202AA6EA|nr:NAD(P)H-dependent glycerol-3-phosphate dehydrogenase [Rhodoflexus caldus]